MKKLILALALIAFAAPVLADSTSVVVTGVTSPVVVSTVTDSTSDAVGETLADNPSK